MKDLPVFTTENGAASLILREIAYQKTAYVRVQSSQSLPALVEECVSFCRAVGAEAVFAAGHPQLEQYPFHTAIVKLCCLKEAIEDTDAALFPVQEHTLQQWLDIYRQKVRHVPNAAWMTDADGQKMLADGDGYFVHRQGQLLGIGRADWDSIRFLAAVKPGAGADVVKALCHAIQAETVTLEAASANHKAMQLYRTLGFLESAEISRWYKIF